MKNRFLRSMVAEQVWGVCSEGVTILVLSAVGNDVEELGWNQGEGGDDDGDACEILRLTGNVEGTRNEVMKCRFEGYT